MNIKHLYKIAIEICQGHFLIPFKHYLSVCSFHSRVLPSLSPSSSAHLLLYICCCQVVLCHCVAYFTLLASAPQNVTKNKRRHLRHFRASCATLLQRSKSSSPTHATPRQTPPPLSASCALFIIFYTFPSATCCCTLLLYPQKSTLIIIMSLCIVECRKERRSFSFFPKLRKLSNELPKNCSANLLQANKKMN